MLEAPAKPMQRSSRQALSPTHILSCSQGNYGQGKPEEPEENENIEKLLHSWFRNTSIGFATDEEQQCRNSESCTESCTEWLQFTPKGVKGAICKDVTRKSLRVDSSTPK